MDAALREVAAKGLINDHTPSIDLFDLDYFESRVDSVLEAFPEPFFLHAAAMKANSMRGILQAVRQKGMGAECASISEAVHALSLGFDPATVILDSPCKTKYDLALALNANVVLNLDNELEMSMVDELLRGKCKDSKSKIGLRINPVVGGGAIAIVSTATKLSKFGIPLTDDTKQRVLDLYKRYEWLTGVHVHVGSQGVPLELFVKGAKACMEFVAEVESVVSRRLSYVDIGGGLSTSYVKDDEPEAFRYSLYRQRLQEEAPELFSGLRTVVTEFGRSLFLKAGKSVTRVEHVKRWIPGIKPIILTHVGTNQFIREAYLPDVWRHRFSLAGPDGVIKGDDDEKELYDIAGPMCFQGDYLAKNVELPAGARHGDLIVVHDTGAYGMAMYSKFNSILPSAVFAFRKDNNDDRIRLFCIKERETPEETLAFWGRERPREVK